MAVEVKDNKGNTYNVGLINNSIQNNLEITQNNEVNIKGGILNCIKTVLDSKTIKIVGEAIYDQQKYLYGLRTRLDNIPNEYLSIPRKSIVGPMCELFRYYDEEEYIRNIFSNILLAECDNRLQKNVLPSFKSIVEQLSIEDANFLLFLKQNKKSLLTIIKIRYGKAEKYSDLSHHILLNNGNSNYSIIPYNKLVIDNLKRLEIIKNNSQEYYISNKELCEKAFKQLKSEMNIKDSNNGEHLFYKTEILEITDFGENFIDICCS